MLVAIDGLAASGKGTLGKKIASHFGMAYLDTGKLYRIVGYKALKDKLNLGKVSANDPEEIEKVLKIAENINIKEIDEIDLSNEEIGIAASIVSAVPGVRQALLGIQRKTAKSPKGAVLDGRDIGTVVCPDADIKLFIVADLETRAERRFKELQKNDSRVIYSSVLQDLRDRDDKDKKRSISPLTPAKDAILVDTTRMSMDQVFDKAMSIILSHTSGHN